jgi:hypothetical protein
MKQVGPIFAVEIEEAYEAHELVYLVAWWRTG